MARRRSDKQLPLELPPPMPAGARPPDPQQLALPAGWNQAEPGRMMSASSFKRLVARG